MFKPRLDNLLGGVRDANRVNSSLPYSYEDLIPAKEASTLLLADVIEVAASYADSLGHLTNLAMCRRAPQRRL